MKSIRLSKLILKDFQGGSFILETGNENVSIFADNGVGKTRLASAFSWLLFDKDSLGRSDFEIKNLDAQGEAEHGLEHSVEAVLELQVTGEMSTPPWTITLKKTYKELWQKKRGSATSTFTGHTTEYFIDGVPVQKKDYQSRIAEIAGPEDTFRLLTSPTTFPALHWQKQRALLLDVCGDLTDAEVIESDSTLADLPAILGKRKLDDHRKVVTARRTEINKEIEKIPVRIDENRRALPDVTGLALKAIEAYIPKLETAINEAKLKLQGVDTGGNIAVLSKQLAGINADIQKLESYHYAETMKSVGRLAQKYTEVSMMLDENRRRVQGLTGDATAKGSRLASIESELVTLRQRWGNAEAEAFQDTIAASCAACGQSLPAERIQAAREKALAIFNGNKADVMGHITTRGTQLREEKERIVGEIDALTKERDILLTGIPGHEETLKILTSERDAAKALATDYTAIPAREDLIEQKANLESMIKAEREGHSKDINWIRADISLKESRLATEKENFDKFTRRAQGELRIEDLMAAEKLLAAEYERLEKELYLCDQFVRRKVSLLTERINSRFEIVKFKLFNELINGGLEEVCEITVGGIPYSGGLNNAGRIQAGCDVIRTLQQHYGLQAPVIIDNRESVVKLPEMPCQLISLFVSAGDKVLRVETAKERVSV